MDVRVIPCQQYSTINSGRVIPQTFCELALPLRSVAWTTFLVLCLPNSDPLDWNHDMPSSKTTTGPLSHNRDGSSKRLKFPLFSGTLLGPRPAQAAGVDADADGSTLDLIRALLWNRTHGLPFWQLRSSEMMLLCALHQRMMNR